MKILLIDNGTTLLDKLKKLIPGDESVVSFDTFTAEAAAHSELIILSGSSEGPLFSQKPRFTEEISFIRETKKPVIGICFGHELIVQAFGGSLHELPQQKVGTVVINVERDHELFWGRQQFSAYENHRWGIKTLPDDFEVLASSEHGPEVIRHKSRPIYGFQFHPENCMDKHIADEIFLGVLNRLGSGMAR